MECGLTCTVSPQLAEVGVVKVGDGGQALLQACWAGLVGGDCRLMG